MKSAKQKTKTEYEYANLKWILTIFSKLAPAGGPAGCGSVELAGVARQADGSDVVGESDGAAEPH